MSDWIRDEDAFEGDRGVDDDRPPTDEPACVGQREAPAYVQGELSASERARFEEHLAECSACRAEVADVEVLLERLRRSRRVAPAVDLVGAVMERVSREHAAARRSRRGRVARWAAAAALLVGGLFLAVGVVPDRPDLSGTPEAEGARAVTRALEWLRDAQEPAGGWSAERWGGLPEFDIGVSGLSLLAVLHGDKRSDASSTLARGVDYLISKQEQNGRFGTEFDGAVYNHGIASVALLEVYGVLRAERLRAPIGRAIEHLLATQSSSGGWGYAGQRANADNTAATCWPLQALLLARALGWESCDAAIDSGLEYLARACDERGRIGYRRAGDFPYGAEGLSSMGAFCVLLAGDGSSFPERSRRRVLDQLVRVAAVRGAGVAPQNLYRDFFVCASLGALQGDRLRDARERLARLLVAGQLREGPEQGAFALADRWTAAGGRLYSTALAVLSLESPARGRRLRDWLAGGG